MDGFGFLDICMVKKNLELFHSDGLIYHSPLKLI